MEKHYDGQFIHVVDVTTTRHASASLGYPNELRGITDSFIVMELCATYPDPLHLVKVIWSGDDADVADRIGAGSASTYGAKLLPLIRHDPTTCQDWDCVWARMTDDQRRQSDAWARDADRIEASPGRYW